MISPVHVKTQPADCSQSQKQDNGIGMIDFNFPAMVIKTVVGLCDTGGAPHTQ